MKVAIALIASLCLGTCCSAAVGSQSKIVAKFNPQKLHLVYTPEEGGGTYSPIDSGRVVIAEGKELLVIDSGIIRKRIKSPGFISTFDISKHGNGIIVSDSFFYRVKNLQIQNDPIRVLLPGHKKGSFIFKVDIINETTVRIIQNEPQSIILANIDSLESNRFTVFTDVLSRFTSFSANQYIGQCGQEYFFLEFTAKDGVERVFAFKMTNGKPTDERTIAIGDIGRSIPMTCPLRYDADAGFFYTMLVQQGNFVVRKFNIKDFVAPP